MRGREEEPSPSCFTGPLLPPRTRSSEWRLDRLAELVAAMGGKAGIGPPGDRQAERSTDDEPGNERHGRPIEHLADEKADQGGADRAEQALQCRGGAGDM